MRIKVLISGLLASALLLGAASIEAVDWAMGIAALMLQLVFAYAWPRLVAAQSPWPLTIILSLCSLAATAATLFMPGDSPMSHGIEVIAAGVLLVFISQVLRGAEADGRMAGAVAGTTGVVMAVLGSAWGAAGTIDLRFSLTLVTVLGLLGSGVFAMTRLPNRITMTLGPLVAACLGAAATALPLGLQWYEGVVIGAVAGLLVSSIRAMALSTRSVQNLTGVLGIASGMILISGATSWYALELLHFG
ncbi:hypothetical protein [Glutamicibacter sp.]|uniref:hypothetical protein n=1 Tax=Glutamicibacter sp. TaxID=1931995 RepID=UPI0028BD8568|nr:hypothetical protein [Glutamicibacter sp.]